MAKGGARLVTGLFRTRAAAEAAANQVMRIGYTSRDIGVVMTESTRGREFGVETGNKAAEGAGVGGTFGGAIGAIAGAIAAVGTSLVIPGLGLVVAGPIVAGLVGAGAGGAAGSLIGGLVGAGIPEHRAQMYEAGLKKGGILLAVEARTEEDADRLEKILENIGAENVRQE